MGLALYGFITTLFAGLVIFLVTAGIAGRMFVDVPPTTGPGGKSAANTAVVTAKETITVAMMVEIAFIVFLFLSQLVK
jgi:hypothetical protein